MRPRAFIAALSLVAVLPALVWAALAHTDATAQEDWVIRSFDARYEIAPDGTVAVTEDLSVDFGGLERHGIFRDIPVRYQYDDDNDRLAAISGVSVDNGSEPWPFELISSGANLRIKIGDPDRLVTGAQRYRLHYAISGGLNPFTDHDELYWNVTGDQWEVTIERATATVAVPSPAIQRIDCFQGPAGSTTPCESSFDAATAVFTGDQLSPGSGLTVVVGIEKGAVQVGPPALAPKLEQKDFPDYFRVTPLSVALMIALSAAALAAIARLWWVAGRDRWFGDMAHAMADPEAQTMPLFAHETVVVEYQPPEVSGSERRRLRPAEIGVLVDERADTLDVSATIVDLAVRKHLLIKEVEEGGIFGLFKSRDYELTRLETPADGPLPYESKLLAALFESGETVNLSELKNKFHEDLAEVKEELYLDATKSLKLFPRDPEKVRNLYRIAGLAIAGAGGGLAYLLGRWAGGALAPLPLAGGGLLLLLLAPLMPRRTAQGRQMYRRCLGFRLYMVTAEKERQRFAERENIFHDYLPYAIVFQCVKKWAEAFESLGNQQTAPGWYVGTGAFVASDFADGVSDFSSSLSNVMASTPGGRGGSGFGGGSSGGGGGGGSW
ncbi:MAG: DUF2207 domain-containing protein [Dehalococcoidia bacterium]|nr:DUF2207 domain-containing protein [Dehalococcoidia bacterium]